MKKVLILVHIDVAIYNLRKEIVERLLAEGHEVTICCPYGERIELMKKMGCRYVPLEFDRRGTNPLQDLKQIRAYKRIIREVKPDVIFSYSIKPNLYGTIAARANHVPIVTNITGLGNGVLDGGPVSAIIKILYRLVFSRCQTVFVQNTEILQFCRDHKIAEGKLKLLPGSGINLKQFRFEPYPEYPDGQDTFLFVGRITRDKGVEEFFEAAERIKKEYPRVRFQAAGYMDGDYEARLQDLQQREIIEYLGFEVDTRPFYRQCSAVVLPTYHEGMANVLLEGAATGRPILASRIPGCQETFEEGVGGFGFQPHSADALYEAMKKFIALSADEKAAMGRAARQKVESEFSREIVVDAYLQELNNI